MVIKERVAGEIIQANGCYTNQSYAGVHTSKLNRNVLGPADMEKAVLVVQNSQNSKIGAMHATYAPQLHAPHHVHSIQRYTETSEIQNNV